MPRKKKIADAHTSRQFVIYCVFVLLCIFVGGNSAAGIASDSLLIFAAIFVLFYTILSGGYQALLARSLMLRVLFFSALALPLLQLIPLPADFIPGGPVGGVADQIRGELGLATSWFPLTFNMPGTIGDFFFAIIPITAFLGGLLLTSRQTRIVIIALSIAAALSIFLGVVQFSSQGNFGLLYDQSERGLLLGFFANRNHHAVFLVVAFVFLHFLLGSVRNTRLKYVAQFALTSLVLVAVLGTASRSGAILLALAIIVIWFLQLRSEKFVQRRPKTLALGSVVFAGVCAALVFVSGQTIDRYATVTDDMRFTIWQRTMDLVAMTFPFGSGLGTFVSIYKADEQLADLSPFFVNHAHNDYLELALEGGLPAMVAMAGLFIWLVSRLPEIRRGPKGDYRIPALIVTGTLLAHSLVDYPLRTPALACIFGLALAVVAQQGKGNEVEVSNASNPR